MEFIKAEEFLKQPEEVKNVLLDWINENISDYDLVQDENRIMLYKDYFERGYIENDSYPLFTEGQLRQFIEEKTKDKYDILYSLKTKENVGFYKYTEDETKATYEVETHDLLQAYWEVAIKVAMGCL